MTNHYPTCSGYGQCDCAERQSYFGSPEAGWRRVDNAATMLYASDALYYAMFGVDRTSLRYFELRQLRLPARELRGMTVEETESALLGLGGWEGLADQLPELQFYGGLQAWLP